MGFIFLPTPTQCTASTETAQLLLIVSDGRGLFLEGKDRVLAAVQAAQNANIFVIFVVLDNPNSRVSEQVPKATMLCRPELAEKSAAALPWRLAGAQWSASVSSTSSQNGGCQSGF